MNPAELHQRLTAYFHDKGNPAGEPLEEDQEPLLELLKALAAQPELPATSRALCERLILEQLPWAEEKLTVPEVERLQGFLSELCEPATLSGEKDTAILRAIHVAAPEPPRPWFVWDLSRFLGPGLSLCAGLAVMFMVIGRPSGGDGLAPPWLEIERFRGEGYPVGQSVEVQWGTPSGGFFHLFDLDTRQALSVVMVNRALAPGLKLRQRFVVSGPPGGETLFAACTAGHVSEFVELENERGRPGAVARLFPGVTSAQQLRDRLSELARARQLKISFTELKLEVVPAAP